MFPGGGKSKETMTIDTFTKKTLYFFYLVIYINYNKSESKFKYLKICKMCPA